MRAGVDHRLEVGEDATLSSHLAVKGALNCYLKRAAGDCKGQLALVPGSSHGMLDTRTVRMFKLHQTGPVR